MTRLIAAIVDLAKIFLGLFTSLSTYYNEIVNIWVHIDDGEMEYDLRKTVARTQSMYRQ